MEYLKIQSDMMKQYDKSLDGLKHTKYFFQHFDKVTAIAESHWIMLIPNTLLYVDCEKIANHVKLDNLIKSEREAVIGIEPTSMVMLADKDKVRIFRDEKGNEYKINDAYLKLFTKNLMDLDLTFKTAGKKSPIFLYDGHILIGMILPIA